ncbi:helix-turn-helix transcriptional regulator [Spirillospora sp. NPDC048911]|uniref:helix-turn-helix transcriptional regulator n=1 Tax=Spirillospora sp. NPDC048911 TaxID=3364527 RepID=UPI003710711C
MVDGAGAAAVLGMAYQTFRNRGVPHEEGFPAPVNPGRRKLLYDLAQVEAYRAGRLIPDLPAPGDADDLLDEHETAEVLGVAYATVRKDRNVGRMPDAVMVHGLPHWRRTEVEELRATRRAHTG